MAFLNGGSAGSVFEDFKSRFGFGRRNYDDYGEEYDTYSDNFDDYSTYDEDEMDGYGSVTERDPLDGRRSAYSQFVSMDDVYNATPRVSLESTAESRMSSMRQSFKSSDYYPSGSVEREYAREPYAYGAGAPAGYGSMLSAHNTSYAMHSLSGTPARRLTVVVPSSYEDAERVSRGLRSGDAVVLNMKSTRPDLMKRVLDFSFGAASILDAKVDCIGEKVFVLSIGAPLSESEHARLRSQGVIF